MVRDHDSVSSLKSFLDDPTPTPRPPAEGPTGFPSRRKQFEVQFQSRPSPLTRGSLLLSVLGPSGVRHRPRGRPWVPQGKGIVVGWREETACGARDERGNRLTRPERVGVCGDPESAESRPHSPFLRYPSNRARGTLWDVPFVVSRYGGKRGGGSRETHGHGRHGGPSRICRTGRCCNSSCGG